MDSSGGNEGLGEGTSGSNILIKVLASGCVSSDILVSGTSSKSTAVSAGEFSRLSPISGISESTRVPLLAPEVVEKDLSRLFVGRADAFKRSGDNDGGSDEDTRFVCCSLVSGLTSKGGDGVESGEGEGLGSGVESEHLALRGRLVRRFGATSPAIEGESASVSLALRFLRILPPVTGSYR